MTCWRNEMSSSNMKTLKVGAMIGGVFALVFVTVDSSIMAQDNLKIVGFSEPALPTQWLIKNVDSATGKSVGIRLSNAVALKAYGKFSPFLSIVGHALSPKGAGKSMIIYGYSAESIKGFDWKGSSAKGLSRSALVFPDQKGGYRGYFINAKLNPKLAAGAMEQTMFNAVKKLVANKYGEAGPGIIATLEKLKDVPVAVKLAVNTDAWMLGEGYSPAKK